MLKINADNAIELTRGDTARIALAVTKSDGTTYDFSNDTVLFSVKASVCSKDVVLQKVVTDGTIYIAPSDTAELKYGDYIYDVELTTQSGDVCTIITPSRFTLTAEVTW